MTRQVVITNTSNWENEDWVVIKDKNVSRGGLTTADMPPSWVISPGESLSLVSEGELQLRIVPTKNKDKEAKHVDHAGWEVEAKGKPSG